MIFGACLAATVSIVGKPSVLVKTLSKTKVSDIDPASDLEVAEAGRQFGGFGGFGGYGGNYPSDLLIF